MAWSYAYPGASQGSEPVNYYTWRTVKGNVQMRLTDVAINGGAQWYSAMYTINLISSTGQVLCDTRLHKTWNVPANFSLLFYTPTAKLVRMQVTASVYTNIKVFNTWKSELRWDNGSSTP